MRLSQFQSYIVTKCIGIAVSICLFVTTVIPDGYTQMVSPMPQPGTYVGLSAHFQPPRLSGIRLYENDPFKFDFLLDLGDISQSDEQKIQSHSERLMRYFLMALTVPETDLWVNLSPYEQDRIIPDDLGLTELGRDMLAQDYLLKQLASSLHHPDHALGEVFWNRIQQKIEDQGLDRNIDIELFNKVWVVPKKAVIYEDGDRAYIVESELDVLMEEDYLALAESKTTGPDANLRNDPVRQLSVDTMKEIVIPELRVEVNEGGNFATLRQIYNSLILARWYKQKIQNSIINQVYSDQLKTAGNELPNDGYKLDIYKQYVSAFEKGAYKVLKENYDPNTQAIIPKQYFSGGIVGKIEDMSSLSKTEGIIPQWIRNTINRIKTTTLVMTVSLGILSGGSVLAQDEQAAIINQAANSITETAPDSTPDVYQVTKTEEALIKFNVSMQNIGQDLQQFSPMLSAAEIEILKPQLEERLVNTNRNVRVATALTVLESEDPGLRNQALEQLTNESFSEQIVFERLVQTIENWENETDENIKAAGLAINNQSMLDKGRYSKQLVPIMMKSYMLQELYHPNRQMRDIAHEIVDSMKFWFREQYKITSAEVDEIKRQRAIENLQTAFSDIRSGEFDVLEKAGWDEFIDGYFEQAQLQKLNLFLKNQFDNYGAFVAESKSKEQLPSFDKFIVSLIEQQKLRFYENQDQIMVADDSDNWLFVVKKDDFIVSAFANVNYTAPMDLGRLLMMLLAGSAMGTAAFKTITRRNKYRPTLLEQSPFLQSLATPDQLREMNWRKMQRERAQEETNTTDREEVNITNKDRMEEAFRIMETEVLPDKREILQKMKPLMIKNAGRAAIFNDDSPQDILMKHLYVLTGLRNYPPFYLGYTDGEFIFRELDMEYSVPNSQSNFTIPLTTERGRKIIRGNWFSNESIQDSEVAQAFMLELFGEPPGFFERMKQSLTRTSEKESESSTIKTPVGGIDFASDKLIIETEGADANGFIFNFNPDVFENIDIDGLIPQIQTISPVNLPQYLRIQ